MSYQKICILVIIAMWIGSSQSLTTALIKMSRANIEKLEISNQPLSPTTCPKGTHWLWKNVYTFEGSCMINIVDHCLEYESVHGGCIKCTSSNE